jgi:F-type H+-transporting ATPase subunit delta
MTNKTAATRYARALLDVAVKESAQGAAASGADGALQRIEEELAAFVDLFTQHPTLEKVLLNPAVPVGRKQAAVAELTARLKMSSILGKLIMLLAERDRLVLLPEMLASYRERLLDHQQVVRAEVTTAVPLAAERTQAIQRGLAQLTGRTVTLATKVNPSIIGGVVARIGSTVYDGSVTTQLQKMRQRLVESV